MMMKLQNEQANIQRETVKDKTQAALQAAQISIKQVEARNEQMKITADLHSQHLDRLVQMDKAEAEKTRAGVDLALSVAEHQNRMAEHHERRTM